MRWSFGKETLLTETLTETLKPLGTENDETEYRDISNVSTFWTFWANTLIVPRTKPMTCQLNTVPQENAADGYLDGRNRAIFFLEI